MPSWVLVLITILSGILGGVAGAVLLEACWKPWQVRRRVATLLRAEVRSNLIMLEDRLPNLETPDVVMSQDLLLPQVALDAVIGDVGTLPGAVSERVINLYHSYAKVLRAHSLQAEAFRAYAAAGSGRVHEAADEFKVRSMVLRHLMTRAIAGSRTLADALDRVSSVQGLPWSLRARREQGPQEHESSPRTPA